MKDKLTALEAAMLGLWLMGMRWVARDERPEDVWAYSEKPKRYADCWRWESDAPVQPVQMPDNVMDEYLDLTQGQPLVELAPWLLAHGITPPEVET